MLQAGVPERESEGFSRAPAHVLILSSAPYLSALRFWFILSYLESWVLYAVLPRQNDVE